MCSFLFSGEWGRWKFNSPGQFVRFTLFACFICFSSSHTSIHPSIHPCVLFSVLRFVFVWFRCCWKERAQHSHTLLCCSMGTAHVGLVWVCSLCCVRRHRAFYVNIRLLLTGPSDVMRRPQQSNDIVPMSHLLLWLLLFFLRLRCVELESFRIKSACILVRVSVTTRFTAIRGGGNESM